MTSTDPPALVSVVMIFWDERIYLDEAVRSVLSQSHPVELLLCDDGSTDGSTAIARDWAAREPHRIRYLAHPGGAHCGMSATRNLGIRAARGQYVAFLDADDIWEEDHISSQVGLLRRTPEADLVCGSALEWHSWSPTPDGEDTWTPLPWPSGTVVPPPRMLSATLHRGAYRTPTCSLLVRRTLLADVGGAEDSFGGMFEDQALLAKLHLSGATVISGSRSARYRRHAESSTARSMRKGAYDPYHPNRSHEGYLRWLRDFAPTVDTGADRELQQALDMALAPYRSRGHRLRAALRRAARSALPQEAHRIADTLERGTRVASRFRVGVLGRMSPVSREFGFDRGLPVDRYYVEQFLAENAHVVAGRVLEVGDASYTRRFGGDRVTRAEVLNVEAGDPETTYVADLADGGGLPSEAFDCIVLTQTLHLVYDLQAAVRTLHRMLRPGGTLLATFPGISPLSTDRWADTWHWALTPVSAVRLFGEVFGSHDVEIAAWGNVVTSTAFLYGMAVEELHPRELHPVDPQFPMLITARASRPLTHPSPDGGRVGGP